MRTKIGPHILNPTPEALDWAANAPIVKWGFRAPSFALPQRWMNQRIPLVDILSTTLIQEVRAQADALAVTAVPLVIATARPGATIIIRPIWMLNRDGRIAAQDILDRYAAWGVLPSPNLYTELWNEFDEWGRDELRERLRQGRIAGDILRAHGFKVGDNIASTGTLEEWEWLIAAEEGFGRMDFLPVHAYWGNQGLTDWHALRHRRMHDILNGNHPIVIVTETGRDRVEGGAGGWLADGISLEQFVGECKAYDTEIQKDDYVLGATPFTSGPSDDWRNYDMDSVGPYLIEEKPMLLMNAWVEPEMPIEESQATLWIKAWRNAEHLPGAAVWAKVHFPLQEQALVGNTGDDGIARLVFDVKDKASLPIDTVVNITAGVVDGNANGVEKEISFRIGGKLVEFRDKWPELYARWKAAGGVSDIDFLAWVAATQGYEATPEEFELIASAVKGNVEALKQLAQRPKA